MPFLQDAPIKLAFSIDRNPQIGLFQSNDDDLYRPGPGRRDGANRGDALGWQYGLRSGQAGGGSKGERSG